MRASTTASLMAPALRHQAPWFSFLIHLRERGDIEKWSTAGTANMDPVRAEARRRRVLDAPPMVISTLRFRASPAIGEVILIPRLPEDVIRGEGRRLIARAVEIAAARGSHVIGLGGLTAPATRGGETLLAALPRAITITNGNAFTAVTARANVREARAFLERPRPNVAVLGSTGSVGGAVTRLLADDDVELLLIGRSVERAQRAVPELVDRARFSCELADVDAADIVLVLTGEASARLAPEHFRTARERVVIDVAQPPNVDRALRPTFLRRDVHVAQGGWVQLPGVASSHAPGRFITDDDPDAPRETAPACVAETWLFAVEGIQAHAVGTASAELARVLERSAARRGVRIRPLSLRRTDGPRRS